MLHTNRSSEALPALTISTTEKPMKRLLIIDDNEPFLHSVSMLFQKTGYQVRTATEGTAALSLFRTEPFDAVITDLIMPGMEGLETMMHLRRLQPGIKIVVMSGGGFTSAEDYLNVAKQLGAAKTLVKPFTNNEILESVAALLAA